MITYASNQLFDRLEDAVAECDKLTEVFTKAVETLGAEVIRDPLEGRNLN